MLPHQVASQTQLLAGGKRRGGGGSGRRARGHATARLQDSVREEAAPALLARFEANTTEGIVWTASEVYDVGFMFRSNRTNGNRLCAEEGETTTLKERKEERKKERQDRR